MDRKPDLSASSGAVCPVMPAIGGSRTFVEAESLALGGAAPAGVSPDSVPAPPVAVPPATSVSEE